jgi:hypothetical protein
MTNNFFLNHAAKIVGQHAVKPIDSTPETYSNQFTMRSTGELLKFIKRLRKQNNPKEFLTSIVTLHCNNLYYTNKHVILCVKDFYTGPADHLPVHVPISLVKLMYNKVRFNLVQDPAGSSGEFSISLAEETHQITIKAQVLPYAYADKIQSYCEEPSEPVEKQAIEYDSERLAYNVRKEDNSILKIGEYYMETAAAFLKNKESVSVSNQIVRLDYKNSTVLIMGLKLKGGSK